MQKGPLISSGRTAEVFAWGADCVLKLFYDWVPLEWADHEAELAMQVARTSLPVPACQEMIDLEGRRGIVYQRLYGPTLLSVLSGNPIKLPYYAGMMADVHQQIHQIAMPMFPSLKNQLKNSIDQVHLLSGEVKTYCLIILDDLPEDDKLCHFDFHPDQIIMTEDGPYIIDWGAACKGDPLADVARTSLIVFTASVQHLPRLTRIMVTSGREIMHKIYINQILKDEDRIAAKQLAQWKVPIAAARLNEQIPAEEAGLLTYLQKSYARAI